jgi:hypothetical protein
MYCFVEVRSCYDPDNTVLLGKYSKKKQERREEHQVMFVLESGFWSMTFESEGKQWRNLDI